MDTDRKLTLLGHLRELRRRLLWIALTVVIGLGVSFVFAGRIIDLLKAPVDDLTLQAIEPTEIIGTYFKIALNCGIAIAIPMIIYQGIMFVRPALAPNERRYLYTLLPPILLAFIGGVVFAYFVLIPPAITFLSKFGSDVAQIQWRVSTYVTTVIRLLVAIGLCFETPIVIYFLARIGLVTAKGLSRFRRWAIVGAFVIGGVVTPTFDPLNQTLVAAPLIVLYEVGVLLARFAQRRAKPG